MPVRVTESELRIPGLTRAYTLLQISDAHVVVARQEDGEAAFARAKRQIEAWAHGGFSPAEVFEEILAYTEQERPDALLMAGDCVDYVSTSNAAYMAEKLSALSVPVLYAFGNHEGGNYDEIIPDPRSCYPTYASVMGDDPALQSMDLGDVLLVAMDDCDRRITPAQLAAFRRLSEAGKPIILLMHIPVCTEAITPSVMQRWNHTFMIGNLESTPETLEFCELVKSPDAPVKAIQAGHVHFAHEGEFASGRTQYTSAPAFEGFVRRLRILPEDH